ncbi:MAG TPA: ATP-binding protein [Desulfobacterales bacterium]|nr:ATP-binding protein [Desulfobacterales bacterium]
MREFTNGALSFLMGAIALSLFSTIQKTMLGHPLVLKGYFVPVIVGGSFGLVIGMWRLKLKKNEKKMERLNLMLRTIRNVNKLLVKEKDPAILLQETCDNIIENRGYYNVWFALLNESEELVATVEAGLGKDFLPMIHHLKRGELTDCGQRAMSQPGPVITYDPTNCTDCPLLVSYGDRGAMTMRLECEGNVYGIVSASIPKYLIVDEKEQRLFEEVVGDVAFALHRIKLEEDHKKADEALLESEQRFRHLVENSLLGICIIQNNQIIYQNPEQEKILGPLPRKPLFSDRKNIHPDDVEKLRQFHQAVISGEVQAQDIDFRFYLPDNTNNTLVKKWVQCRASIIEYQGEEAILVNMMDVSRSKEMERLLRIQDKMSALGRVAAGIAHEIRNPLSGINIYLNTLEKIYDKRESLEKVKGILGKIQSASIKIEFVIKRVMDFSKPSEPKFVLTDINKPIKEALNLSEVMLRKREIEIEKSLASNLPLCQADPNLIEQVILNLINNATEAMQDMRKGKKIEITSSIGKNCILMTVSDSGPGVPLAIKDQLFDPFYSTKSNGTGIGLSISNRIITDHGGSMDISESRWGGAEFRIELPIKKGIEDS